jgi:hypothetical protein
MENKIDEIEADYEKKIEELQEEKNSRTQQEITEDWDEYGTVDGPYPAWKEDAYDKKEQQIDDLYDEIKNEDRFQLGEEVVKLNQEKLEDLYDILGKQLNNSYEVHIYHLINKYKKYRTSAIKYYEEQTVVCEDKIGEEWKLIDQSIYLYDIIQQYHDIFQTNISVPSLSKELIINDFQINVLNFNEIDKNTIENCLNQFHKELKSFNTEYADRILFYKYYTHKNFWILLAGYYYDKFLEHTFKKRSFYENDKLAPKIYDLYIKLQNGEKLTQTLLKHTLK